ncbi:TPA: hypothetical protein SAN82_001675 [Pseudomonas putida]|nr:hypothetical protein [Pseudomonas putida]
MLPPSTTVRESPDATPTYAARHQALLEEYDQLLVNLRDSPASSSALTHTFIKPHPFSPLDLDVNKPTVAANASFPLPPEGHFSLAQVALYYGMAPWERTDGAAHQAAIHALEEKRARHALQLECGVDVDSLACTPNDADRLSLSAPASTVAEPFDIRLARLTMTKMKEAIRQFLPIAETSLIGHLAKNIAPGITVAQIRQSPSVYLEKVLQSADAIRLAQCLLEKLDWYGKNAGEKASPFVRNKLLSKAIRLWEQRDTDAERDIAGYPWHQRSNYGKSYQAIWREFEDHLLRSKRASSESEAILLACLYRSEFPSDFRRSDIPVDLPYRSSLVWVNFVHGLNLAEAIEPERVPRMSFQQLVDFPLQEATSATQEVLALIAWSRIPPAVDWAIANGILLEDKYSFYSDATQERAIEALDRHTDDLKAALLQMDIACPTRLDIADREIQRVFGPQVFTTDGTRLIMDHGEYRGQGARLGRVDSFRDVYMWKGHATRNWRITLNDGETPTTELFTIDSDGHMKTTAEWIPEVVKTRRFPDVNQLFDNQYKSYLTSTKAAYQTLLTSLLCRLPHDDRQAIEYGETQIYTLRQSTNGLELKQETPTLTMPLRLRMGFILRLSYNGQISWYECLPRAGIIRKRTDFTPDMIGGRTTTELWRMLKSTVSVDVRRGRQVPFDWDAHEKGSIPKKDATCTAIIEQLGEAFTPEPPSGYPPYISSSRASEVATFIAKKLFYFDEAKLYASARQETELERLMEGLETLDDEILKFLPFYGNLDDLDSDNPNKRIAAIFGMFTDAVSFALPLGKFVSGTVKLTSTALRMGFKNTLPPLSRLSGKLLTATLQNFNPLDGMPTLAKGLVQGLYAMNRFALNAAVRNISTLAGRAGKYDFVKGVAQVKEPGRYRLLSASDELAFTKGISDIPVRKVNNGKIPDYRMIDPVANKPYGPPLLDGLDRLWVGRSVYHPIQTTDDHVFFNVADNAKIRELPEINGSSTIFINDVPYRLDGDQLRRIDLIDESAKFKRKPCRVKRAPGEDVCINEYMTDGPHPDTPALGTFDDTKYYAPWFGERLCTPTPWDGYPGEYFLRDGVVYRIQDNNLKSYKGDLTRLGFEQNRLVPKNEILANLQFRKGIYGRIEVRGTYEGTHELHRVGAILVPSLDGSEIYVFTRLNSDKCYLTTIPAWNDMSALEPFTMRRLTKKELAEYTLGAELLRVYEGSLNANNTVAIHGVDVVENAMKTMDQIAIPIGSTANPPANMQWVSVDTSPGEALMFDNATRMIVSTLPTGATSWSRSKHASQAFRERCADIFDALFVQKTIIVKDDSDLRINWTMDLLQAMLPANRASLNPRNIAYADVVTSTGKREVYVSVSGAQGLTGELPLFNPPFPPDKVTYGDTTYFNIDFGQTFTRSALNVSDDGVVLSLPRTSSGSINRELPTRPTSLDSEAKLISVLREKYPDPQALKSVDVATTMPPCNSCAVVIKEFGYDGTAGALNVLWG